MITSGGELQLDQTGTAPAANAVAPDADSSENGTEATTVIGGDKLGDSSATGTEQFKPSIFHELARATKTGWGMFVEAYFVFAIGNVGSIWKDLYPGSKCFGDNTCTQVYTAITYVQIAGIILAQLTFGFFADHLGRLWGSRLTASLMFIGGLLLTISYGANGSITGQMVMFNITVFIFTLGVGGEYPMAATSASERAESENLPRGRTVVFVFAHQGWGNVANTIVLCFLLAVTGTGGCTSAYAANSTTAAVYCNSANLELVWRLSYAFGVVSLAILCIYRWFFLKESTLWEARQIKYQDVDKAAMRAKRVKNTQLLFSRKYFPRLFGAGFTWFLIDVAFYGNKLFQGTIIKAIIGSNSSLQDIMNYTLLNSVVGLAGYYFAAFFIDFSWMGRVRMQNMGFAVITILFLVCGFCYSTLVAHQIQVFEFIYLLSSFFVQFGPNVTTWLLPVELFPTDVRAQAHGYCAAFGKSGALFATLLFSYGASGAPLPASTIFIVSGFMSLAGLITTVLFVPDVTHMSLHEMDRRWSEDHREDPKADQV